MRKSMAAHEAERVALEERLAVLERDYTALKSRTPN